MANQYQNPVWYANEMLRELENNIVLGKVVMRTNESEFGKDDMKIGDTINIRRPWKGTIQTGAAFNPSDYTETSIPLVVNAQKHVDLVFTSSDMTLKLQEFSARVLRPAAIKLGQQIDIDGYVNAKNTVGNLTGTAGTAPNTFAFLTDIGKKLDDFSAPRDGGRYYAMDQASNASQIGALTGFFQAQNAIAAQYKDGVFIDGTNTVGLKIAMSQNIARHTVGALGGTPLTNGANQSLTSGWANTYSLITDGWTAAAAQRLNAGDVFTIANVNSVNPVTLQSTGQLMQFCVVSAASSDASGNLTVVISPAPISAGPFQNITAAPADNAALTVNGTAATGYARNLAWHKDAFQLACVPLVDVSKFGAWGKTQTYNGFSMRIARQYAISSDSVGNRADTLYGWATPYPEQATQQVAA